MKRRKHWYKIHITECPVCGDGSTDRERVYGRKPKDPKKRYVYYEYYDYCDV